MSEILTCEALTKCYDKDKTALDGVDQIGRASCRERV